MRINQLDYCDNCGTGDAYSSCNVMESDFQNEFQWEIFKVLYEKLNKLCCRNCIHLIITEKPQIKDYYDEYLKIKNNMDEQFKKYIEILEERDGKPLTEERKKDLWNRNVTKELKRAYNDFRDRTEHVLQRL